jgi:uncharacterized Zn finger protein
MAKRKRRVRKNSPIAENIIHVWVGEAQFNRGLKYVDQGLVYHTIRRGNKLTARCDGKRHGQQHYQVRAVVIEGKIEEAICSCSIGKYGVCPHIAAVLVTFSRTPEQFKRVTMLGRLKRFLGLEASPR